MIQKKPPLIIFLIPIISLIIAIATLSHYGINWDEPYHYRRGSAFLQYLLTGKYDYNNISKYRSLKGTSDNPNFRNGEANFEEVQKNPSLSNPNIRRSFYQDDSWDGNFFINEETTYGHPALNDVLAALFNKIFYQKLGIFGDLESYRLLIVSVVALTIFAVAIFMWSEFGVIESIFSSLSLAIYPLILGEQHFNIKDPVEASFYTLTIITAYLGLKKNKLVWLITSVLFFALAMATKFNIVFAVIPLFIWLIYFLVNKKTKIKKDKLVKNIIIAAILSPFVILGLIFITYPTLWKSPITNFELMLKFYKEVGYPSSNLFNIYPSVWILFTTPPAVLFLFGVSLIFIKKLIQKNSFVLLLIVWLTIAVLRNSLFGALSYGGVRLIMEYIPALCMLAGIGAGFILKKIKNKNYHILAIIIALFLFVPTISKLIKIHPNEDVYFNFLIGGLSGAKDHNIPSWGDSYGNAYYQGLEWINKNAELNAKASIPVGLTTNIPRFKLRPDIAVSLSYWSGLNHNGEYLIELTYDYPPMNWFALEYLNNAMTPVYEVKVDGIAIAKVWKNDTAHIKKEYTKERIVTGKVTADTKNKTLKIELPSVQKVMKIEINEPIQNCSPLKTGFVTSSIDGNSWTRENEDIANDQLNRGEPKPLTPNYNFLFFARIAKTFIFNTDSSDNCLLKAENATVNVLTP